jgi:hypothetical protein
MKSKKIISLLLVVVFFCFCFGFVFASGTFKSYNRTNAVNYAVTWATGHNPNYPDFSTTGGDCTNFASQAIEAGGAPQDKTGSYLWYPNWKTGWPYSAWRSVNDLYKYLTENTWTGPVGKLVSANKALKGDLVQFDFDTTGTTYDHTCVITNPIKNTSGQLLTSTKIACHSTGSSGNGIFKISDKPYKKIRFIQITGYYD